LKFLGKLRRGYIWRRILLERLAEPLHLNAIAAFVFAFGSFRSKVAFDLVLRHHHAYGILSVADQAAALGLSQVTLLEFGVAAGAGILNMADVSRQVTKVTGIAFQIYGFDTGKGMPPPTSARDHPELYQAGDFVMSIDRLQPALPENVHLIIGDIAATVPEFLKQLGPSAPVGFVSLDVDYYSSSVDALTVFAGAPELYLPRTCMYVDDLEDPSHNSFCGEQLAIHEFNAGHELRKIEHHTFLRSSRVFQRAPWIDHMYTLHVLDHPTRTTLDQGRIAFDLVNPYFGVTATTPSDEDGGRRQAL
jgi:hypothetical protein